MRQLSLRILFALSVLAASIPAWSQTCQMRDEIPDPTKSAIESAAQQVFNQAGHGDVDSIKTNSTPSLQSNVSGKAGAVNDNKAAMEGASPKVRNSFLRE